MKADAQDEYKVVVDTNVLISFLLKSSSVPGQAVRRLAEMRALLLFSEATHLELVTRAMRPKFDRYRDTVRLEIWLDSIHQLARWISPQSSLNVCRDPDDNKFLALAFDGDADCIITGDQDLLVLHPFQGIPILSPADFLGLTTPTQPAKP